MVLWKRRDLLDHATGAISGVIGAEDRACAGDWRDDFGDSEPRVPFAVGERTAGTRGVGRGGASDDPFGPGVPARGSRWCESGKCLEGGSDVRWFWRAPDPVVRGLFRCLPYPLVLRTVPFR